MVIGVAGKLCSGKSTVALLLEERGFHHIDVDRLGHEALLRRKHEVIERFGDSVRRDGGEVDRRKLGEIVFSDSRALSDLEAILHPEMVRMVEEELARRPAQDTVINAAVLFPMGLDRLCDGVLWIASPWPARLVRCLSRDGMSLSKVLARMWAQRRLSPQQSRSDVDTVVVRNASNKERLRRRVATALGRFSGPSQGAGARE